DGEDSFAGQEQLEEKCPEERGSGNAADDGKKKNERRGEDAGVVQQIACSAEPAEEGCAGESVDGGETVMRGAVSADVGVMSEMDVAEVAEMQMAEASDNSKDAEDKTNDEADEIEGVHDHWVPRFVRWFVVMGCGCRAGVRD